MQQEERQETETRKFEQSPAAFCFRSTNFFNHCTTHREVLSAYRRRTQTTSYTWTTNADTQQRICA